MAKEKAATSNTSTTQPVVAEKPAAKEPTVAEKPRPSLVAASYLLQCGADKLTSPPRRGRVYDKVGKNLRWARAALLQPGLAERFEGLGAVEDEAATDSMFGCEDESPKHRWLEDAKIAASDGLIRLPDADGKLADFVLTAKEKALASALLALNVNPNE